MPEFNRVTGSGDGTRPTTSGGVDNIGAGSTLGGQRNAAGEPVEGPAPDERMSGKRKSVEGTKVDDSAAFELKEDLTPTTNRETPPKQGGA